MMNWRLLIKQGSAVTRMSALLDLSIAATAICRRLAMQSGDVLR